jgi:hypothetical protein
MEAQSKISLKESERRWKILLERTRRSRMTAATTSTGTAATDQHKRGHAPKEDPFDCACLAVPPTFDLVQDVATRFVQEWRDLDERKVVADGVVVHQPSVAQGDGDEDEDEDEEGTSSPGPRKKPRVETAASAAASSVLSRPVWYEKHVRLPEHFDYASRQSEPPVAQTGDDRVISLTDPNQLLSYHEELWNLFRSIPTVAQLQEDAVTATATTTTTTTVPEEEGASHSYSSCMQHTQKLQNEITDTLVVYPRLDGHALSRLRFNDRHDPVPLPAATMPTNTDTTTDTNDWTHFGWTPTIRFECWRRQPRRGTTPDPHRMVLEFSGSQTLLDFHRAIVELAEDELWSSSNHTTATTDTDTDTDTTTTTTAPQNAHGGADKSVMDHDDSSGFFFLEGIFYTTGSVDYTSPIVTWLQSGSRKEQDQRAAHLGLPLRVTVTDASSSSDVPFPVRSMADTLLEDLSLRLGIRYLYCCHGDVECSILCTDRRLVPKSTTTRYPIVHDIWMPSYLIPECEACRHRVAVIATSTECQETGGHVALCEDCSRQLQLQTLAPDKVQEYSVWKSQADLSAGAATSDSLF